MLHHAMTFDAAHFFIFVLSGFMLVWTFRYITKSKKQGDFEYAALSVFWGLVILMFYELVVHDQEKIHVALANPYAVGAVLSIFGILFGFFGGWCSNNKKDFVLIFRWIKRKIFKKKSKH